MENSKSLDKEGFTRIPSFDWDKAKYFFYVARIGSISEAAKFLNLSQSSLSKKITILEDRLNCKLLIRTPKGIKLTRKGQELYDIIEIPFINLSGFSYNPIVTTDHGQKRKIRIATTQPIASYVLNEHLISYNQLNPDVVFEIIANDQLIDIVINDVDLAIRPYDFKAKGIEQTPLFTLEKKLFAGTKYIEKYGEPKKIEDLNKHYFISYTQPEKHPYSDIFWSLRLGMPANELREPVFTSNVLECLIEATQKGLGIFGGFEKMSIVRNAGLKNILPDVVDQPVEWYCNYPQYYKKDQQIIEIKDYLCMKLA